MTWWTECSGFDCRG